MEFQRLKSVVFDCAYPQSLARFWAQALGYRHRPYSEKHLQWLRDHGLGVEDDPSVVIDPPEGTDLPTMWFNKVPEGKAGKNRVHLDVYLRSENEIDWLLGLGAHVVRPLDTVPGEDWAVMADPEGNEFCAFPPRTQT